MSYETIRLQEDERGVATLTLNRPDKHNAMSGQMIAELTDVAAEISARETIRVVILTGAGKSFCAGGDLNWMKAQTTKDRAGKIEEATKLATMLRALDDLPQPLIARVQGNAFGGGVGMMCVSDIVIAVDGFKWGLTETKLGLIPATIGPYVVRRLGEGASRRAFMNSKVFGASHALQLGLASEIVDIASLDDAVEKEAGAFLACAPHAVAHAKMLCKTLARMPSQAAGDAVSYSIEQLADRWEDAEAGEGISAFLDKRSAPWVVG